MESLYLKIAERLRMLVPELSHIDEDTGQLYPVQYDDRYGYPILFPCCLIDASTIDFKTEKFPGVQRGTATVTIKVAFQCDEDSHYTSVDGSGSFREMGQRLLTNKKVVCALHGYCFGEGMSELQRIQSRAYSITGRVKVYETSFRINISEDLQLPE